MSACLLCAGLQERVEELKQVMAEDKSTKDMLKVRVLGPCWTPVAAHAALCEEANHMRFSPHRQ